MKSPILESRRGFFFIHVESAGVIFLINYQSCYDVFLGKENPNDVFCSRVIEMTSFFDDSFLIDFSLRFYGSLYARQCRRI